MMSLSLEEFMICLRDTSAETKNLEDKLDALTTIASRDKALDREDGSQLLVVQTTNQKPASVAKVCGIYSSNDHHTSFSARNDVIVIRGVHDVSTNTSAKTRKLEGKLDALVNLVTQLAPNQKPASIERVCEHYSNRDKALDREDGSQLIAVTQIAANQKFASVTRVCGVRSSNDHDTSVHRSSQQYGVDEHPQAYAANTYSRPPQQGVHDMTKDTYAETRMLEGKLDALVNLVTQLAANQKPASVARVCSILSSYYHHTSVCSSSQQSRVDEHPKKATSVTRVCGIRSSNDHHISDYPSSQQSGVDDHPEAYAANTYSRPPQ
ncbi:hypothetical protein Fmac_028600 [Flemingia macrophylla]|uniref:Uncharacterized protein n=1 Tax=Flemingia macrophylla TaxID=520843 RepID=A0ABD1L7Z8_9FABA